MERTVLRTVCAFLIITVFYGFTNAFADHPVGIHTPNGSSVPDTWVHDIELSPEAIAYWNQYVDRYPGATRLSSATRTYNCHSFAWRCWNDFDPVWIGQSSITAENVYWNDGSYVEKSSSSSASKVSFDPTASWGADCDHSAITASGGYLISKWGPAGLVKHLVNNCPYWRSGVPIKYYELSNSIGVPNDYPTIEQAVAAAGTGQAVVVHAGASVTLAGNVSIPTGVTLILRRESTVSLNGRSLVSTGGTIAIETGATINGLAAKLMYGSQLKGLCGKVQTAIDNCAYPYSVHIQSGNFNELVTIINKPNIIVGGEYGTLVNGISIYNSDGAEVDVLATHHLFLSGCTLPYLQEILVVPYSEEAEGSFFAYNNSYMNLRGITLSNTPYGYGACFSNTTGASYPPGWGYGLDFANNECATVFYSGSSFTLHQPHFCSNGTDISTDPSSSVTCVDGPTFSGDPHQTTYGNVGWTSYSICGQLSRSAPPSRSSAFVGDTIMDKFQSLNAFYHEISGKTFSDKGDRSHAFARFSDQCKSFISLRIRNLRSPKQFSTWRSMLTDK